MSSASSAPKRKEALKAKRKYRKSPARKDALLRRYETTVGRDKMLAALAVSEDERASALLNMMLDPAYRSFSFAKLCQRVGLRYQDMLDLFRRYSLDLALLQMSTHLPEVMRQTAEDARSRTEICGTCAGAGETAVGKKMKLCRACNGRGEIYIMGNMTCRKLVWDMMVKRAPVMGRTR